MEYGPGNVRGAEPEEIRPDLTVSGLPGTDCPLPLADGRWFVPRSELTGAVFIDPGRLTAKPCAFQGDFRDEQALRAFEPLDAQNRVYARWIGAEDNSIASLAVDRVVAFSTRDAEVLWVSDLVPWMDVALGGRPRFSTLREEASVLSCLSLTGTLVHIDPASGRSARITDLDRFRACGSSWIGKEACYVGFEAESGEAYRGDGGRLEILAYACRTGEPRGSLEVRDTLGYVFERPLQQLEEGQLAMACGRKHSQDDIPAGGTLSTAKGAGGERILVSDISLGKPTLDGCFPWHIVTDPIAAEGALWFFAHSMKAGTAHLIRMTLDGRWKRASEGLTWKFATPGRVARHRESFLVVVPGGGLYRVSPAESSPPRLLRRDFTNLWTLQGDSLLMAHSAEGKLLRFPLDAASAGPIGNRNLLAGWGGAAPAPPPAVPERVAIRDAPHLLAPSAWPPGWITWRKTLNLLPSTPNARPQELLSAPFGPRDGGRSYRHLLRSPSGKAFGVMFEGKERQLWIATFGSQTWSSRRWDPGDGVPLAIGFTGESVLMGQHTLEPTVCDSQGRRTSFRLPAPTLLAVSPASSRYAVLVRDKEELLRPYLLDLASGTVTASKRGGDRFSTLCASASGRLFQASQEVAGHPGIVISELDVANGKIIRNFQAPDANLVGADGEVMRGLYPNPAGTEFAFIDEDGTPDRLGILGEDGRIRMEVDLAEEVEEPIVWSADGRSLALWYERGLLTVSIEARETST